jgi:drug/metabolite transporter (DMT)-like permease
MLDFLTNRPPVQLPQSAPRTARRCTGGEDRRPAGAAAVGRGRRRADRDSQRAVISVIAALAAALVFGISSVAEQRGTRHVKERRALSPRLLLDLVRDPLWVTAIGATVLGFTLQVIALKFGRLAVVEPLLICDLIFAVLINSRLRGKRDPVIFIGAAMCAAGVAGFLVIGHPSGGKSTVGAYVLLPLAVALAALVAGCLYVASRNKNLRPLALALACGVNFGVAAFLVKIVTGGGLHHLLTTWPIYALAVVGPLGFLLNQNAFQESGDLISPVLSIITAADPLISILLAFVWLNERLNGSPAGIAGQIISLALMVAGIVIIARHAPQATTHQENKAAELLRSAPDTPQ